MARKGLWVAVVVVLTVGVTFAQSDATQPNAALNAVNAANEQSPDQSAPLVVFQPTQVNFRPEQADFRQNIKDIPFDYDRADIKPDVEQSALLPNAEWLKSHPNVQFYVDGYADWRGSVIYNMVLAGERAEAVKNALLQQGVSPQQIRVVAGWGKLYPLCADQDENCWQQNRRVHLTYALPATGSQATSSGGR